MSDPVLVERVARAMIVDGGCYGDPDDGWKDWAGTAASALRAILETHAIVPREPTGRMIGAYVCCVQGSPRSRDVEDKYQMHVDKAVIRYKAMLAAAPEPLKE